MNNDEYKPLSRDAMEYSPISVFTRDITNSFIDIENERIEMQLAEYNIDKDALIHQQKIIEELRRFVEKDRWIPVSERLPEENIDSLVLFKNGICIVGSYEKRIGCCDLWYANTDSDSFAIVYYDYDIIAWRPLPATYEENI